jgi:hypothetical protein
MVLPAILLGVGFTFSAVLIYGLCWVVGASFEPLLNARVRWTILGAAALILTAADLLLGKSMMPVLSWRRQTPRIAFNRFGPAKAALLWGLDTGLAFTTYRTTSLTWLGFAAALLNLVPWWAGMLYAVGFAGPILTDILAWPNRKNNTGIYASAVADRATIIQITARVSIVALAAAALWRAIA